MVDYVNAAPMVVDQGTNDNNPVASVVQPLTLPQHLPKYYIYGETGKVGSQYVDTNTYPVTSVYGDDTFDQSKQYYTHSTLFLQHTIAEGNNCVIHRLYPDDGTEPANVTLYLDVLPVAALPVYMKNADGSLQLTVDGDPIQAVAAGNPVTCAGFQLKWVAQSTTTAYGTTPAVPTISAGTQTSGGTTSQKYPIFQFAHDCPGSYGNRLGISLAAQLQSDQSLFPSTQFNDTKNYPYVFALKKMVNVLTGRIASVANVYGSNSANFILEKNKRDPATKAIIDAKKIITDAYINFSGDINLNDLGSMKVFDANVATLAQMFYNAEKVVTDVYRDSLINTTDNNIYAVNLISFTSSNGSPYQALKVVDAVDSIRPTRDVNIMFEGGTDGTILVATGEKAGTVDLALFDSLVAADADNYADPMHEYMDLVLHPESHIHDSGYGMTTKLSLAKFISRRRDTFVDLATYGHDVVDLSIGSQISRGQTLQTVLSLYPESSIFGTSVCRGTVLSGSGILMNGTWTDRVPTTIELAVKSAALMGASDGRWKDGKMFDSAPGSVFTLLKDLDITWIPSSTRNTMWAAGITFAGNYSTRNKFFPAIKTVYNLDSSTLNSYFTACAICYANKVEHAAWRQFTGNVTLTDTQFVKAVNGFVAAQLKDRFNNAVVLIPDCTISAFDAKLGWRWNLAVKIGGNGMKTVQSASVQAFRMSDLPA